MKNNRLYKFILSLFNVIFMVGMFLIYSLIDSMVGRYTNILDETISNSPTIFYEIISYVGKFVLILGIYILVYRALVNIITRKDYKNTGFNIFAKTVSIIICISLVIGGYLIFHNSSGYIYLIIYILFILLIPLLMIWALSRLFRLKYQIKEKKYILIFALSVAFIIFGIYMFIVENASYSLFGSFQFSFYLESALIPICLVNVYTLLVVRETNKENKLKEIAESKKEVKTVEIENLKNK